jgi:hypothetical protein
LLDEHRGTVRSTADWLGLRPDNAIAEVAGEQRMTGVKSVGRYRDRAGLKSSALSWKDGAMIPFLVPIMLVPSPWRVATAADASFSGSILVRAVDLGW